MTETTVRLMSWTINPLETLVSLWEASRTEYAFRTPAQIAEEAAKDIVVHSQVRELAAKIMDGGIPIAENISFTFVLDHVSVALREQMVRHRIGVHVGERLGVDIIPELADSTWWAQSMRVLDMGEFADRHQYAVPECVGSGKATFPEMIQGPGTVWQNSDREVFERAMLGAQWSYRQLRSLGWSEEDARNVLPLACTHRISWTLNLAALSHIIGKRGCWILQLGIWRPVIVGMVEELSKKVDPIFRRLIQPPCIKGDKFHACVHKLDNEKRVAGSDPLPPCSLYLHQHRDEALKHEASPLEPVGWGFDDRIDTPAPHWKAVRQEDQAKYERMKEAYRDLWQRNPETGERLVQTP